MIYNILGYNEDIDKWIVFYTVPKASTAWEMMMILRHCDIKTKVVRIY